MVLGRGYLYCGRELTWLSVADEVPLQALPEPAERSNGRTVQNFMLPIITSQRMFVIYPLGSIYIFNLSALDSAPKDAPQSVQADP